MSQYTYNYDSDGVNQGTAIVPTSGGEGVPLIPYELITEYDCVEHNFFLKDYSSFSAASPTGFTATHASGGDSFAYTGFGPAPDYVGMALEPYTHHKVTFDLEITSGVGPEIGLGVGYNIFIWSGAWQRATAGENEFILSWDINQELPRGTVTFRHLYDDAESVFTVSNISVKKHSILGPVIVPTDGGDGRQDIITIGEFDITAIKNVSIGYNREAMTVTAECDIMGIDWSPDYEEDFEFELWASGFLTFPRASNTIPAVELVDGIWIHHTQTWDCGVDIEEATTDAHKLAARFRDHGTTTMTLKVKNPNEQGAGGGGSETFNYEQDIQLNMDPVDRYLEVRSPTKNYVSYGGSGASYPYFEFTLKDLPSKASMQLPAMVINGVSTQVSFPSSSDGNGVWVYFEDGTNHTDHMTYTTTELNSVWVPYGQSMSQMGEESLYSLTGAFWRRPAFYRANINMSDLQLQISPGDNTFEFQLNMDN